MIEDERSLLSIDEFRRLFYTYFKGEARADIIFEQMLPCLIMYEMPNKEVSATEPTSGDYKTRVSI